MYIEIDIYGKGGDRQVRVSLQLYVLDGLQSNKAIKGMGFLKKYNPPISWIDCHIGMPCLTAKGGVCQSSRNDVAKAVACSSARTGREREFPWNPGQPKSPPLRS